MDLVCYSKGKIYKVVCNITGKVYIGSTCKELSNRLACHRSAYKRYLAGKGRYVSSFEIIKNGNSDIVLLELVNCNNKMQLHQKERHFIDTLDCVNKNIPSRTKQECDKQYRIDNTDKIREYNKQYYIDNSDKIKEHVNCQCGGSYTYTYKAKHLRTQKHINYTEQQQPIV
jgi:hypothetical protein